ncbi:LolA family protein [Maribellus sediminis]|uniref:LolA family protein n=1 Tax=Maribellus sediminis TaxID=2696285 RepID=UPI0014315591|nr:outer membrane lipoprotein carrier protein LolA [Maribellus sediminis]
MKRLLAVFAVLLAANLVWAQNDKAKQILDEVSAKTKTFKSMSADFVFTMDNDEMEIHEKNEGTIHVKGQKYVVKLPKLGVEVYSDGETIWNYMKDGNQVTISNLEDAESELMDPSSIFSIYERGFKSEFVAEMNEGGKTVYKINLFPDSEEYQVTKIEVSIDKATLLLSSATLHATDDNTYSILVKKMEPNKDFSDSEFVFDKSKYGDVEVIDFR